MKNEINGNEVKAKPVGVPLSKVGALFGRSVTWGYRLKYKDGIKVVVIMGIEYVDQREIDRLLAGGDGTLPVRGRPRKAKKD